MADQRTFVIIGASLAGAKAAETLRTEGFDGRVVLIGEEPVRPYERPPLSKDYLRGEVGPDAAFVHDEGYYDEHGIELLTSTSAQRLDVEGRQVTLDSGETVSYDAVLLTTGAAARRLSITGSDLDGVHYLRTMEDADRLREALGRGGPLVVIGAGWIGCEVAASARQMGVDVALVEMGDLPLERVLGPELGRFYRDVHAEHGVDMHFGTGIEALRGGSKVDAVDLTDGTSLPADVVVVGVGVAPRTELAEAAGLTVDNGIVTDEHLAASVTGVYAAGDVASAWHPVLGRRIRLEHWSSALNQGPAAAKNMLGEATPYTKIPYFYSDQYDVSMEYAGLATTWDDVVFRGDPASREFIVFWTEDHRVRAGMNVNVWDVNPAIAALVSSGNPVDRDRLADPDVELTSLAP
ncbi:MAG TPA: FAD-dependent oxidoreductase [Acidimicrobiales bacterium]|nr:FAD-dependent oxidoreductase [Acidimicrobiales bacterium]